METQEIYDFMNGRDVSSSFSDPSHNSEVSFEEFIAVDKEAKKVKAEILSKKAGTFVLEEAIPAEYELDENEIQIETSAYVPTVFYVYTTNAKLVSSITSELDISKLV